MQPIKPAILLSLKKPEPEKPEPEHIFSGCVRHTSKQERRNGESPTLHISNAFCCSHPQVLQHEGLLDIENTSVESMTSPQLL